MVANCPRTEMKKSHLGGLVKRKGTGALLLVREMIVAGQWLNQVKIVVIDRREIKMVDREDTEGAVLRVMVIVDRSSVHEMMKLSDVVSGIVHLTTTDGKTTINEIAVIMMIVNIGITMYCSSKVLCV